MMTYALLLRGINVGGKNKVSMAALKACLEELGFTYVVTYIASGNVIVKSPKTAREVQAMIEAELPKRFSLDAELIRVLVLTRPQLKAMIINRPKGFGDQPDTYHSDAIFLMGITATEAMTAFRPKEGVDRVWPGHGVIYSQRLSALRVKSRLSRIVSSPLYKFMTIRNWNTTVKLLELLEAAEARS